MRHKTRLGRIQQLLILIVALAISQVAAAQPLVAKVNTHEGTAFTRIWFESTRLITPQIFLLTNPSRLVIDVDSTDVPKQLFKDIRDVGVIDRVRAGGTRVVLDLAYPAKFTSYVESKPPTNNQTLRISLHHRNVNGDDAAAQRLDVLTAAYALLYNSHGYWTPPEPGFDRSGVSCRKKLANSSSADIFRRYTKDTVIHIMQTGGANPYKKEPWTDKQNMNFTFPGYSENHKVHGNVVTFDRYTRPDNGSFIGSTYELDTQSRQLRWIENLICEDCVEEQLLAFEMSKKNPADPEIWCAGPIK
jgi:hypothetical protein